MASEYVNINQGTQTPIGVDNIDGTLNIQEMKINLGGDGVDGDLWDGKVSLSAGTITSGSISVIAGTFNTGTISTLPDIPGGTLNSLGTLTGVGTISNIGSISTIGTMPSISVNPESGTLDVLKAGTVVISGGTINAGTVSASVSVEVGTINEGTLDVLKSGTVVVTTLPNLPQGSIQVTAGTVVAGGEIASGSADSGNPVKIGGKFNNTLPTFTDGQRGDLQLTSRGNVRAELHVSQSAIAATGDNADNIATTATGNKLNVLNRNTVFNGASWDRMYGDATSGLWVNVKAGTLPMLSAGTIDTLKTGTVVVSTLPNISQGSIQVTAGTGVITNGSIRVTAGTEVITGGSIVVTTGTIVNNGGSVMYDGRPARDILGYGTVFGGTATGYGTIVGSASVGAGTHVWVNELSVINTSTAALDCMVGFGTATQGTTVLFRGTLGGNGGIQKSFPLATSCSVANSDLVCWVGAAGTINVNVSYFISS